MSQQEKAPKGLEEGFLELERSQPTQIRGVPVSLNAFDCHHIHRALVTAYKEVRDAQEVMYSLSSRLSANRSALYQALYELELRIHDQEQRSGIGGTNFHVFKPLKDEESGDQLEDWPCR